MANVLEGGGKKRKNVLLFPTAVKTNLSLGMVITQEDILMVYTFPDMRLLGTDKVETKTELICPVGKTNFCQALAQIRNENARPAALRELDAFAQKHPAAKIDRPIFALGTLVVDVNGKFCVPCLIVDEKMNRTIVFIEINENMPFIEKCCFAIVRL